jgi:ketosteroid isomerase-like protein
MSTHLRSTPIRWAFIVGFLFLFAAGFSVAQRQSGELGLETKEVLKTDAAYRAAILQADIESLTTILKEDLVIVHSDGTTDNRANFLDAISSGRLRLQSYDRINASVHIYGSTALLLSETRKTFTYKGSAATDDDTSLVTYVKEGARWRMVAMQNTHRSN